MNAQEAIAMMEEHLKEVDNLIAHCKAHDIEMLGSDHFPESVKKRHKKLEDKREALSVVLESAKLLHEFINLGPVDILDAERYPEAKKMYLDEEDLLIRSDVAEKIGIEEGADS